MTHEPLSTLPPPPEELPSYPPVEPPKTSFFVQLFLLPAVIVFGIILVWFLFGKLAGSDRSIPELVAIVKSDRGDRWKAALDIAQILKHDSAHATNQELADLLTLELYQALESKSSDTKYIEYLAGALGNFQLPTGAPMLRRAAQPGQERQVRRSALIALANLSQRLGDLDDPNLLPEMRDLLKDPDAEFRGLAALIIGFQGAPEGVALLTPSLQDPVASVRYDAANALAQLGSERALPVLKEMLSVTEVSKRFETQSEASEAPTEEGRATLAAYAALRSIGKILAKQPQADVTALRGEIDALAHGDNPLLRTEAREILVRIAKQPSP